MRTLRVGGSFAPPLTDELLDKYEALAAAAPADIGDAMRVLLACGRKWWDLPESGLEVSAPHPVGAGTIVPLDEPIAKALWEHIPWADELAMFGARFETIDPHTHGELRDAAHHLLWHVKELDLGREPLTTDRL